MEAAHEYQVITVAGIQHPVTIRKFPNKSDDEIIFGQVFHYRNNYDVPPAYRSRLRPRIIVDAGAHIGLSTVLYKNLYPDARIISIEPCKENYDLLVENTKPYQNIECLNVGLWNKECFFEEDRTKSPWMCGIMTRESGKVTDMKAVPMSNFFSDSKIDTIDLLKMDIEGAEKEVFDSSSAEWLSKVGVILIELHDRMKPGCSAAFNNALAGHNFASSPNQGEHIVRINKNYFALAGL